MDFSVHDRGWIRGRASIVWIVVAAGLVLTGIAWKATRLQIDREVDERFAGAVADARKLIQSRVRSYADVAVGARALYLSTGDDFSGDLLETYIGGLDLEQRLPGVQIVHIAQHVMAAQRTRFVAAARRAGELDFAIKPAGLREEYVVVRYIAPRAGNEVTLGLDLAGDPVRLETLNRVRDSGRLAASGPIALALEPSRYPGFAMRLPVYRKGMPTDTVGQRRAAFIGMVSTSFIVIDVMRGLFSESLLKQLHIHIHDAGRIDGEPEAPTPKNLMFDSNRLHAGAAAGDDTGALSRRDSFDVGGRRWDLHVTARPAFGSAVQLGLPWAVLLAGGTLTLLLAGLVRSLQTSRARAVAWADRATADLRASEARLIEEWSRMEELIEVIPNPIYFKDTDGRYAGVNKAWEAMFGQSRQSFIGKTVFDLYPHQPDIAERLDEKDQALWRNPGTQVYETTITTGQGTTLDAVYYKATYTDREGAVAGLIGIIVDITERKATEQRFRALFDNAAVGIATTDLDGMLTDANQKFLDMLGYGKDELMGRPLAGIMSSDDVARSAPRIAALHADGAAGIFEHRLLRKSGSVMWVRRTVSTIGCKDGRPDSVVNVVNLVEDITDRKQEELRRTMEHAVTRALADDEELAVLFSKVIETICRNMGWEFGLAWVWSPDDQGLKVCATWGAEAPELGGFVADSLQRVIRPKPGEQDGLIRRTYASGEALWISDVASARGFARAKLIKGAGLRGAFAFPLLRGSDVVGVMEFYHRGAHESEKTLVGTAQSIGHQIGQYMGRREAEEALKFMAGHDALTRLPNRAMLDQLLEHALVLAQRYGTRVAVLFIDLDRFKAINDTLGHAAGDALLCEAAARLKKRLRASDTLGRLGGDEFVVLLENAADSAAIGDLTRQLLEALTAGFALSGGEYHVTASIGISIYPQDGADAQTLLKHADAAMYDSKHGGRNAFRFYSA